MDKRYQVFISSTYADLKEERQRVIQAVIQMDCIPAGMELFPAADEEQFRFIKRVIDDCDYYLLIIGGRYGSTIVEGISYTEREFDYAVERGLKVIALVHADPDAIPLGKSEKDPVLRERLELFRQKVCTDRLVKFWKSADELPGLVALSLAHTMKLFPATGWIRADKVASEELLREINDLRKLNAQLVVQLSELRPVPTVENLAGLEEKTKLRGKYHNKIYGRTQFWSVELTWAEIFASISPYMISHPNDLYVDSILAEAAFARSNNDGESPSLDDQQFRTVGVQLQALGLVTLQYAKTTAGGMGLFWSLTPAGERLMMELRTVRKAPETNPVSTQK